jgi:uncharacterized protein (DUF934 family)
MTLLYADGEVRLDTRPLIPLPALLETDAQTLQTAAQTYPVQLGPTDDPALLIPHFGRLSLVAIHFPKFTDGRGYSIAAALRHLGFRGELRATGDVLIDQLFFLKRVGFTSFALRADQDPAAARRALSTYSAVYQATADGAVPAFRRRFAAEAHR